MTSLVDIADQILSSTTQLSTPEYTKKGRKYRLVDSLFKRIQGEDKYLAVGEPGSGAALVSAYQLLQDIPGLMDEYPELGLAVLGCARAIETHCWWDRDLSVVPNSSVEAAPQVVRAANALAFDISDSHLHSGLTLMMCAKICFLHTDHHVGKPKLGRVFKQHLDEMYGPEACTSACVLLALRSFCYWISTAGVFYRLEVPHTKTSPELRQHFASFPEPLEELKDAVFERYPAGCSKMLLLKKAAEEISEHPLALVVPLPPSVAALLWLFEVCHDIEVDPLRYHCRAASKHLYDGSAVSTTELSREANSRTAKLLLHLLMVLSVCGFGLHLLGNSKFPKVLQETDGEETVVEVYETLEDAEAALWRRIKPEYRADEYMAELVGKWSRVMYYRAKQWDNDDIVLRVGPVTGGLAETVQGLVSQWDADSEEEY